MDYLPDFAIEERDEATWLLDGDQTVLCFEPAHIAFGCVRLVPGGPEVFPRPGMWWGPNGWPEAHWHRLDQHELVSFEADTSGPTAQFTVITSGLTRPVTMLWDMQVSYDAQLCCYSYEVVNTATVTEDVPAEGYEPYHWEYINFLPQSLFDYKSGPEFYLDGVKVEFPDPQWGYVVYQRHDAVGDHFAGRPTWMKAPISRFVPSATSNIRVAANGYLGLMNHPAGNPMVQLLGDTAAHTSVSQCNWLYDLHFTYDHILRHTPPPRGFELSAHFRIVSFDTRKSAEVLKEAVLAGYTNWEAGEKQYPRYEPEGVNSFENGITIEAPDHSKIWQPFHHHVADYHPGVVRINFNNSPQNFVQWVDNCGRSGTQSLHVSTTEHGIAGWHTPLFDRPIVKAGQRYRLVVHIRTEGLEGPGATLGYFPGTEEKSYSLSSDPEAAASVRPIFSDTWVRGDSDWTRVEIVTGPMERKHVGKVLEYDLFECLIQPVLWHEGTGRSWFDDFALEELDSRETIPM